MFKLVILPILALIAAGFFGRIPSFRAGLVAVAVWWTVAIGIVWVIVSYVGSLNDVSDQTFMYIILLPVPLFMLATGIIVFVIVALFYGRDETTEVKAERSKVAVEGLRNAAGVMAKIFQALAK